MPRETRPCPECKCSKRLDTLLNHLCSHKKIIIEKMTEPQREQCRENHTPFLIIGDSEKSTYIICLACKKGSIDDSQRGDTATFQRNHFVESPSCSEGWARFETFYKPVSIQVANTIVPMKKRNIKKIIIKAPVKTLSNEEWKLMMPDLYSFIQDEMSPSVKDNKMTIVLAAVKSGKRKMVECFATYTTPVKECPSSQSKIAHFFVTSFVRCADGDQREELREYLRGGDVLLINNTPRTDDAISKILAKLAAGYHIVLHFDELDYGSHYESLMSRVYYRFQNEPNVKYLMYSATVEEAIAHKRAIEKEFYPCKMITFNPPPSFCGPAWFLDHNLVHDCELPFNDKTQTFSRQFLDMITLYKEEIQTTDTKRRIVICRVSNLREVISAKEKFPPQLQSSADFCISINYASSIAELRDVEIKWDDYGWWRDQINKLRKDLLWIIFLEDQSTRSTDWFCHPWLRAYFDYHSDSSCVNTRIQSGERVNFYKNKRFGNDNKDVYDGEDQLIDVFASKKVFLYSAGRICAEDLGMPLTNRMIVSETSQKWSIPVDMLLSDVQLDELMNDPDLGENLSLPLTSERRIKIHKYLIKFAEADGDKEVNNCIRGKSLKYKRVYKPDQNEYVQGGIVTVMKNFEAKYPSQPGGGSPSDVLLTEYCIDIALDDILYKDADGVDGSIIKGAILITCPMSKPEINNGLLERRVDSEYQQNIIIDSVVPDSDKKYSHRTTKKSMFANGK